MAMACADGEGTQQAGLPRWLGEQPCGLRLVGRLLLL